MNIPTKKLKNGFELPVYGLGLWQMGGRIEADTTNDEQDIAAIKMAIDNGITHIDTAEMYGDGHAEELLGIALKDYDRSKLIIASKVSAWNQTYEGILKAADASLKRIGTDYLDLYMLHRFPEPGIDIGGAIKALNELVDSGRVKNIGLSNATVNRFEVAQKLSKHPLVCNQVHYNVQYREIEERKILDHAQSNDVMLVAWRPLQKAELTDNPLIHDIAKKYDKTPYQVMINWLISQTNVVTLSKTSNLDHLQENLGAIGWSLSNDDIEKIRTEYPDQKTKSDAVPLDYTSDIAP